MTDFIHVYSLQVNNIQDLLCLSNKFCVSAPPRLERDLRDQQIEAGDAFKLKIPFSGDGPFEVKVKKDNKDVPDNDRIRISVFDDFATIAIKGKERQTDRQTQTHRQREHDKGRELERERLTEVKVKDNKDIPDNDRIRISVFDDFATIAIKDKEKVRERGR